MAPLSLALTTLTAFLPLALAASSGCGTALPAGLKPGSSTHNVTLSSKSVIGKTTNREYIIHLPSGYAAANNKAAPLVMAFHGQQQPAWSMEKISQLSDPAFNPGSIIVYPEGMNVQDPGVQWLGDPMAPTSKVIDDRIFVNELLSHLTSTLCIDEKRIYAAGLSNGGGLTGLLMCDAALNKKFAAFATVAGAFYPDSSLTEPLFVGDCKPNLAGRTLPYINLHGLADAVVPYDGVFTPPYIPVLTWVEDWAKRDGCSSTPATASVEGGTVTERKWTCGGKPDLVVHRAIDKFGHGWPSKNNQGEPFETLRGGPTTWNATPLVFQWFAKWTL
ncbi:carbohydrate esterase family 1 protein [Stemphylium lycopersici]|nr:carbohydrate esterase family 1 protein [Stemphylium lycopersici]